jgi:ribosomal protein S18 acetylase RimI-like enzyme
MRFARQGRSVVAYLGNTPVGSIEVSPRGEILDINVEPAHQRKGIATALLAEARKYGTVVHSEVRTDDGEAWARSTGDELPPNELAEMLGPVEEWS